jgi:hypothetical protein
MVDYTRYLLQEKEPGIWEDEELIAWLNEGTKKLSWVARIEEVYEEDITDVTVYTIAPELLTTIQEIAWITMDDSNKKIPFKQFKDKIRFYESQTGHMSIYYYRNPAELTPETLDSTCEIDANFHDAICLFSAMRAKMNDEEFLQAKEFAQQYNDELAKAMRKFKTVGTRFIQATS